ncbi:hypothetical protein D3Y59_10525 [Hymenobacter oligotrophus]|uniref:Uncharacterized protein n=1 Tax=Hymenobacter oligotrophus TaxID=2319843 RepID=A0A3B7R0Z2_9BACT|nr:hypothetical protein D3Y59_10525 [Hymenobacter oligotrophus]
MKRVAKVMSLKKQKQELSKIFNFCFLTKHYPKRPQTTLFGLFSIPRFGLGVQKWRMDLS